MLQCSRTPIKQKCWLRWSVFSSAVCVRNLVSRIILCWENAPSLIRMLCALQRHPEAFSARKIKFNFSRSPLCCPLFGICPEHSEFYYTYTKITLWMAVGAYMDVQWMCRWGEFSTKLIPNFQNDRRFFTKCPMLAVNAQRQENLIP